MWSWFLVLIIGLGLELITVMARLVLDKKNQILLHEIHFLSLQNFN